MHNCVLIILEPGENKIGTQSMTLDYKTESDFWDVNLWKSVFQ